MAPCSRWHTAGRCRAGCGAAAGRRPCTRRHPPPPASSARQTPRSTRSETGCPRHRWLSRVPTLPFSTYRSQNQAQKKKKKVSPANLPGGTEQSVPQPCRNQRGMMSLCRIESEASSHLTKRAQLNWQCRALVLLQRHIPSYKTLVSLEIRALPEQEDLSPWLLVS